MDKLLFFGPRVLFVDSKGRLKNKFNAKINILKKNFQHFPEIEMQLTVLFETQMDILSVVLDIYTRMCQKFFGFLQKFSSNESKF